MSFSKQDKLFGSIGEEEERFLFEANVVELENRAQLRQSVGLVREVGGKMTVERHYYLASLDLNIEWWARAVRGHCGVENKLHWVLDVCFRKDQSRARTGFVSENLATLRRLALNLLRNEKPKNAASMVNTAIP